MTCFSFFKAPHIVPARAWLYLGVCKHLPAFQAKVAVDLEYLGLLALAVVAPAKARIAAVRGNCRRGGRRRRGNRNYRGSGSGSSGGGLLSGRHGCMYSRFHKKAVPNS